MTTENDLLRTDYLRQLGNVIGNVLEAVALEIGGNCGGVLHSRLSLRVLMYTCIAHGQIGQYPLILPPWDTCF